MMSDPGKNRTCNPQLRRLLLYPVELRDQNLNIGILNMAAAHKERSQAMFELRDPKSLFLEKLFAKSRRGTQSRTNLKELLRYGSMIGEDDRSYYIE